MIEFFNKWRPVDFVTDVTPPQSLGLRDTAHETKDVTHVTSVTPKYTNSCGAAAAGSTVTGGTEGGMIEELGYAGYEGYTSDTTTTSPVTHQPRMWVTEVTGSEVLSQKDGSIDCLLLSQVEESELQASERRLDSAAVSIAVLDDGTLRIVNGGSQVRQAILDGFTIYSPKDAYYFVRLTPHERRAFHDLKRAFGGTIEWKEQRPR